MLRVRQRIVAEGVALATRIPPLRQAITGDDRRVTDINFYVAKAAASDRSLSFAAFSGDSEAKRNRRNWGVGVVAVNSLAFHTALKQPENEGARRSITWVLGSAVLVGAVPRYHEHLWDADFYYGMRVGPGELRTAPALWRPDGTLVIPPDSFHVPGEPERSDMLPRYDTTAETPKRVVLY